MFCHLWPIPDNASLSLNPGVREKNRTAFIHADHKISRLAASLEQPQNQQRPPKAAPRAIGNSGREIRKRAQSFDTVSSMKQRQALEPRVSRAASYQTAKTRQGRELQADSRR